MNAPICHCGGLSFAHLTGDRGCFRVVVQAPKLVGKHPTYGYDMWDTGDGRPITAYSLFHQRGYNQHEDGTWSRWPDSVNSITA